VIKDKEDNRIFSPLFQQFIADHDAYEWLQGTNKTAIKEANKTLRRRPII
jgi:hypothetical protein